jgi:hypothetical protein
MGHLLRTLLVGAQDSYVPARVTTGKHPEFPTVDSHESVTWDFHCQAVTEIILYLLEINFW